MRDVLEQILGWGVIVGIVLGVILGRRRGKANRADAIAAAHAQGFAEGGAAAAEAYAHQTVQVAVDASHRGTGAESDRLEAGEAWDRVLRRRSDPVAVDWSRRVIDYDVHDDDDTGRGISADDRPSLGAVPVGRDRTGQVPRGLPHGRADLLRVRPSSPDHR